MVINNTKYRIAEDRYFHDVVPKDLIVLHFTAGSTVDGAFNSWKPQTINIGTPYIVDRDGTVYETFDPKYWAYHLAVVGAPAQNHKHDKRSVPIEIVNFGPLKRESDILYSWPANYKNFFCNVSETDKYVKASYRGFDYYQSFSEAQKIAIPALVKMVAKNFGIVPTLPHEDIRDEFDPNYFSTWKGVASHQNFRSDKFDIGPAWDWNLLV